MLLPMVMRFIRRGFCTSTPLFQQRSLVKLKKMQADFQCADGRPVFLKGGFCDRLLYSITILACCFGLFYVAATIFELAKPPSWRHVC